MRLGKAQSLNTSDAKYVFVHKNIFLYRIRLLNLCPILLKFRSSFFSRKYPSLGANSSAKSFSKGAQVAAAVFIKAPTVPITA